MSETWFSFESDTEQDNPRTVHEGGKQVNVYPFSIASGSELEVMTSLQQVTLTKIPLWRILKDTETNEPSWQPDCSVWMFVWIWFWLDPY